MSEPDSPSLQAKAASYAALRVILIALVLGLTLFKLFISYRGLDQPVAMDQAQIARNVAQGKGLTTNFIRPMELKAEADAYKGAVARAKAEAAAEAGENGTPASVNMPENLPLDRLKDTNHAPLNICMLATALKLTGADKFEDSRMESDQSSIYGPDRVVSAVSVLFFLGALALAYTLIARLFDEAVAAASTAFLALSDLMLQYALSGLPQPLMMCCLLGAMHLLLTAIRRSEEERGSAAIITPLCLCYLCIALLCLTSWMGIWVALGLIVFCALYFRPYGSMAVPGLLILAFALLFPLLGNSSTTGSYAGNAFYALYNCFGGGEDMVQRSVSAVNLPFNNSSLILRLCGYTLDQLNTMYAAMGGIIVAPFFFLCLLNRYKRSQVEGIKWASFSMWFFACLGMAVYGIATPLNASQLSPLFAPLFTAFGVALVFNFLARLKLGNGFNMARGVTIFLMLLVSAGSFVFKLPQEIHHGLWLRNLARPHYPPYYPARLNAHSTTPATESLVDKTNERDVVVTDQPWAVAWYANRKALWTPLSLEAYTDVLEPIIREGGSEVQGFLVTPSSHSPNRDSDLATRPGGMAGIRMENGDFAPLAMEGTILLMVPRHNLALLDHFNTAENKKTISRPLASIVSSSGQFPYRHFMLGAEMIYYSKNPAQQ